MSAVELVYSCIFVVILSMSAVMVGVILWSAPQRSSMIVTRGCPQQGKPVFGEWHIEYPPDDRLGVALRVLREIASDIGPSNLHMTSERLDAMYGPERDSTSQRRRDAACYGHHIGLGDARKWRAEQAATALAEIEKMGRGCPFDEPLPPVRGEEK